MNLLLDTHVVLWWRADADRIAPSVREAIGSADTVFVSVASAWEMRHHNDPFDRMLIAQAIAEGLRLVTADPAIARYKADVLLAC